MPGWQTLSSEEVYATSWIRVRRDEVRNHRNKSLTYSVVELRHPSVFIVAMDTQGRILLQQAYKYTLDKTIWEIPAGHSDGEELLTAAKRELAEEAGLQSDDWTDLGTLYQAIGIGNLPLQVFLAKNVRPTDSARDELEEIGDYRFVSFAEIEAMLRQNKLVDAPMIAALYLAKSHVMQ